MEKVVAIVLKGQKPNADGFLEYLFATQSQFEKIVDSQDIPDQKDKVFKIGDNYLKLNDIDFARTKTRTLSEVKNWATFQPYIVQAIEAENKQKKQLENHPGRAKLNDMYEKYLGEHTRN